MHIYGSPLTQHDYDFLDGNLDTWPLNFGAAYHEVMDYCNDHGYGGFGCPTEAGKQAMKDYELTHDR